MSLSVLQPAGWKRPSGYSNGMAGTGRMVAVGGQIGWDAEGRFAEGLVAQTERALQNILAIVAVAGGGPEHIMSMTWYVTDMPAYRGAGKALAPVWRALMGRHYPVMAVVGVDSLVEPLACVEIQATALIPDRDTSIGIA